MAKRPPERYNPGELQHTRANLGELSGDEADRMREILGGEISTEKADGLIEEKYKKLQDLNRRKSDRIIYSGGVGETSKEDTAPLAEDLTPRAEPRYLARVRMNFTAARPEHGVMTLSGAFASVFSFILPVQDFINPKFIIRGDEIFFRQIEELVLSVRGLLAVNQRHPVNRLRNDLFVQILAVLKSWDIEGMHRELTHLQIAPRRLPFKYSANLAKKLFTPIVSLLDLAEEEILQLPGGQRDDEEGEADGCTIIAGMWKRILALLNPCTVRSSGIILIGLKNSTSCLTW